MNATIGSLSADAVPLERPVDRLISIPYLALRISTATGALLMGFIQTFVFARVLAPDRFSVFIVVGGIGYTLWLTDLGLAKILFVNLRAGHLAGKPDQRDARQASAVILFYVLLGIAASLVCVAINFARPDSTFRDSAELGLFLLFIALNLAWYSLRSISIAVDLFLFYEKLELARRIFVVATMLAMLAGLPLLAFLIGANVAWAILLVAAPARLIGRGAMAARLEGCFQEFISFFRLNIGTISRSGTSALSGVFVATFPYYFVPMAFGLGAAPIILEVTFRAFRGSSVIYAAACDLTLPGQTRALATHDVRRLVRTTLLAMALCAVPALFACAALIFAAGPLFEFLLRSAAVVPPAIAPILVVLLLVNVVQIVAEALLQHTGYFRSLARIGAAVAVMMIAATALSVLARFDIVGFLAAYTVVFATGALCLAVAVVTGPIFAAASHSGAANPPHGVFKTVRDALRATATSDRSD
jgi:O-antigen/teichoic acid export membrane protein